MNCLPQGVEYEAVYDTTIFVSDSIKAVIATLLEAVLLVVLVVTLFLQTWRASIIPLLAVPVSVIGTFGALYLLGYSINTLTLFGLVLLSNAANLLIFVAAGVTIGRPALVPDGLQAPEGLVADPLAQAFILTAIVIGFGVLAFAVVLIRRAHEVLDVDDFDELKDAEQ